MLIETPLTGRREMKYSVIKGKVQKDPKKNAKMTVVHRDKKKYYRKYEVREVRKTTRDSEF